MYRYTFLLLVVLTIQCTTRESKEEALDPTLKDVKVIHDEVIAIHDEVMPKLSDIINLKSLLISKMDSMPEAFQDSARIIINDLDASDKSMMEWMRQFKPNQSDSSQLKRYYKEQLQAIQDLQAQMNSSIQSAEDFRDSYLK